MKTRVLQRPSSAVSMTPSREHVAVELVESSIRRLERRSELVRIDDTRVIAIGGGQLVELDRSLILELTLSMLRLIPVGSRSSQLHFRDEFLHQSSTSRPADSHEPRSDEYGIASQPSRLEASLKSSAMLAKATADVQIPHNTTLIRITFVRSVRASNYQAPP